MKAPPTGILLALAVLPRCAATTDEPSDVERAGQALTATAGDELLFQESQRLRAERQSHFHAALAAKLQLDSERARRLCEILDGGQSAKARLLEMKRTSRLESDEASSPKAAVLAVSHQVKALLGPEVFEDYLRLRETRLDWYF